MTIILTLFLTIAQSAFALSIDWHGYFQAESNLVNNYQMDLDKPGNFATENLGGEFISGQGTKTANYSAFFARLRPTVLVNDNVILFAELNLGDPIFGFLGRSIPTDDRDYALSSRRGTLSIDVNRLWLDVYTDFGTLQVGRAPLHWGLGVVFDRGDDPFDRYQSTTDTIRLVSKFGKLSVMPLFAKSNVGNSLAGSRTDTASVNATTNNVTQGSDDVTDVGFGLIYDDDELDFEVGGLFYKRAGLQTQNGFIFAADAANPGAVGPSGISAKMINVYAKKRWYRLTVAAEVPYLFGSIGDISDADAINSLSALGFAGEVRLDMPLWKHVLKFGHAPGQQNSDAKSTTGTRTNEYGALYFHRNYNIANIMFNYNLNGFGGNNPDDYTIPNSPYDTAVVNAKYLTLQTGTTGEQWSWYVRGVHARANVSASAGKDVFVHSRRAYEFANFDQETSLGWEFDLGGAFQWDESIRFGLDMGIWFPGDFFKFNNGNPNSALPEVVENTAKDSADRVISAALTVSTVF